MFSETTAKSEYSLSVDVTSENYTEYLDFVEVEEVDNFNEKTGEKVWLCVRKMFDAGWVYFQSDVYFEFYNSEGNVTISGGGMPYNCDCAQLPANVKIKGTVTYIKKDRLQKYEIYDHVPSYIFLQVNFQKNEIVIIIRDAFFENNMMN